MSWSKIFSKTVFIVMTISFANLSWAAEKKDCVECTYKKVVGAPEVSGLDHLAKIAKTNFEDQTYDLKIKMYCLKFVNLSNTYEFKKDIMESMSNTQYSVDKYWTDAGCRPNRIGGVVSPIVHLVSEEVGGRRKFIDALYKYYQDKKDNQTWLKVINAKNTNGQTILDYIDFMNKQKELREEEKEDINKLISFLCSKGAVFASSSNKCPLSI